MLNFYKINILEDFKECEVSIFEFFFEECFKKEKFNIFKSYYNYYESIKVFYLKLVILIGLDVLLELIYFLGVILNSIVKRINLKELNLSGIFLVVEVLVKKFFLNKDCLNDDNYNFRKSFIVDLE